MNVLVLTSPLATADRPDTADTLIQAAEIARCLRALGHAPAIVPWPAAGDLASTLEAAPALVVNLVEDLPEGSGHLHEVARALDRSGLPYTGAPAEALAALGDKPAMKARLQAAGLPVPAGLGEAAGNARYIVKSATEHASLGLDAASVVEGRDAAQRMIAMRAREFGGAWFAEAYIDGREFNLAILDGEVLPVAEILFNNHHGDTPKIVGYAEKWHAGSRAYASTPRVFPPRQEPLFKHLESLARAAWALFGLAGYARVDFRVDRQGAPYILDVNANPCLAADAGFCAAAAERGLTQADVVASLLNAALLQNAISPRARCRRPPAHPQAYPGDRRLFSRGGARRRRARRDHALGH
ncbi:MAG TPA: hypothetical protein VHB23_01485 [Devosiaceae bacterium]|nr:hypothetical protein [Devosiaceae bacterium]